MSVWTLTGRGLPIKRSKDGWDPFLTIEERDEREGVRPNYDRPLHFHKLYQIPKITKENKDEKDGENKYRPDKVVTLHTNNGWTWARSYLY